MKTWLKENWFKALLLFIAAISLTSVANAQFAEHGSYYSYDEAGFFSGLWHGLLAPWTLILRLFIDIEMYAIPNTGWFYDLGFLIGIIGSLPIGWIAAIISVIIYVL
jgi:hypothetical protein